MTNSVSNVSFRAESAVNTQDLIHSPGKYTTQTPKTEAQADSFEKEGAVSDKKKSKTGAIIGGVAALLLASYVGLSVAVGKGKISKKVAAEGENLKFGEKVNNFFYSIGDSGRNLWNRIRGKKAEDAETTKTPEGNKADKPETSTETKPEGTGEATPKAEGETKPADAGEATPKAEGETKPADAGEATPKAEGETKPADAGEAVPRT